MFAGLGKRRKPRELHINPCRICDLIRGQTQNQSSHIVRPSCSRSVWLRPRIPNNASLWTIINKRGWFMPVCVFFTAKSTAPRQMHGGTFGRLKALCFSGFYSSSNLNEKVMSAEEARLDENSTVWSKFMCIFQMCCHIASGDNDKLCKNRWWESLQGLTIRSLSAGPVSRCVCICQENVFIIFIFS